MPQDDEYTLVDARHIGLDRSTIAQNGTIKIPEATTREGDGEVARQVAQLGTERESSPWTHGTVERLKEKGHHAGSKIKKKLHMSQSSGGDDVQAASLSPILANSPEEQKHARLDKADAEGEKRKWKDVARSPVEAIKSKACHAGGQQVASKMAAKEIPHGQDVRLVTAASELERAASEPEKRCAAQTLSELLTLRQSTFVRWTLDRHVTKVRALPRATVTRKPRAAFGRKNAQGGVHVDWRAYGNHVSTQHLSHDCPIVPRTLAKETKTCFDPFSCYGTVLRCMGDSTLAMDPIRRARRKRRCCPTWNGF